MKYLRPLQAIKLSGLKKRTVYDLLEREKLPALREEVDGQTRYRIPLLAFMGWLQDEIALQESRATKIQSRLSHLRRSARLLKEEMHVGT